MTGLHCLGAEEAKEDKGKKAGEVIAKYGPQLISDIATAARGPQAPAATPPAETPTPTWVYPVVAVAGLAVVGGIIVAAVKK
jgi:hypothetical protein